MPTEPRPSAAVSQTGSAENVLAMLPTGSRHLMQHMVEQCRLDLRWLRAVLADVEAGPDHFFVAAAFKSGAILTASAMTLWYRKSFSFSILRNACQG